MTNQPEALHLAYAIEEHTAQVRGSDGRHRFVLLTPEECDNTCAELRRLHAMNQELLAALKLAKTIIGHPDDEASKYIAAAIAKAEGEKQ